MEFEKKVPEWNAAGSEPPASLKNSGFTAGYKPPAPYFNWFWNAVSACLTEIRSKLKGHAEDKENPHGVTASQAGALPIEGGALTGALTVKENFNINKTYDNVEYKTYVRPVNYELGGEYTTAILHYIGTTNNSQLLFNKNGVAFRDNVNGKLYLLYGQHNKPTPAEIGAVSRAEWEASLLRNASVE